MKIASAGPGPICDGKTNVAAPTSLKEGVDRIEGLLAKAPLCQHDAEKIKATYLAMEQLESRLDTIPEYSSLAALTKISDRVLQATEKPSAEGLVSLAHMEGRLTGIGLPLQGCTEKASKKFVNKKAEDIAARLPTCCLAAELDKDVSTLLGAAVSSDVKEIIEKKKEAIEKAEKKKARIVEIKGKLQTERAKAADKFPSYFDELLELGCVELCDLLFKIRAGLDADKAEAALTFPQIAHIILETRNAFIQRIKSSIPKGARVLLLIGLTGSGKSTSQRVLAGDKMQKNTKNFYDSLSDKGDQIGKDGRNSCTFLPNIEVIQDVAVIDFPGFYDTNGKIVALGIKLALKAVCKEFNPQILVVESITNSAGKYKLAGDLKEDLDRLFLAPKETLKLGITKYAKHDAVVKIQEIEMQQLLAEEQRLEGRIEGAIEDKVPEERILQLKQQLLALRSTREQRALSLPDTADKAAQRANLKQDENDLKASIGLEDPIRFDKLEDPKCFDDCFQRLIKKPGNNEPGKKVLLNPENKLDDNTEKSLIEHFENSHAQGINQGTKKIKLKKAEEFEREVYETSLIKTVFSDSEPEISEFVHLPEMDPNFVGLLDEKIVDSCITQYIDAAVGTLNEGFIKKLVAEAKGKVPEEKIKELEKSLTGLKDYVKGLLGIPLENSQAAEAQWKVFSDKCKASLDEVEKRFGLTTLAFVGLCIPLGIPYGIFHLIRNLELQKAAIATLDKAVVDYREGLDKMHEALQRFEQLKRIIKDKKKINDAFKANPISIRSFGDLEATMRTKIEAIQKQYGPNWDDRVKLLAEKIKLTNFDRSNTVHKNFTLAHALWQLEPKLFQTTQCQQHWMGVEGLDLVTLEKAKASAKSPFGDDQEEELRHTEDTKASCWLKGWAEYLESLKKGETLFCGSQIDQTSFIRETQKWSKAWGSQGNFSKVHEIVKVLEKLPPDERTRAVFFIFKHLTLKKTSAEMACFKCSLSGENSRIELIGKSPFPEVEIPEAPYKNSVTQALQAAAVLKVYDEALKDKAPVKSK